MNPNRIKASTTKKKMVEKNKVKVKIMVEKEVVLKDCPFCGGTAHVADHNDTEMSIECHKCGISMYHSFDVDNDFQKLCVDKWNRRVE